MDQLNINQTKKRSDLLNVITILSIIASVLGLMGGVFYLFFNKLVEFLEASGAPSSQLDELYKIQDNAIPLALLTIVSSLLCLIGAVFMRKLKKNGLPLYLVGEWLPIILTPFITGISNIGGIAFSVIIALVFTILYLKCRPELVE